jgi:hypothetical protein
MTIERSLWSHQSHEIPSQSAEDKIRLMGETTLRLHEITNHEDIDIILNQDADLAPRWGYRLIETFQNGIPSEWDLLQQGRNNVMTGLIDGKRFVAKLKERRLEKGDAQMSPEEWSKEFITPRKLVYAEESILNEIKLSPDIKTVLAQDDVQDKIQQLGFSGISLIEPIIGGVSRTPNSDLPYAKYLEEIGWHKHETDKFLVYEYIAGTVPEQRTGEVLQEILSSALRSASIEAENGGDLRPDHFLVDKDNVVHLYDIERFTRIYNK